MLCADRVMDTDQPRLEIGEDEMDDGQELLCHFGIPTFGDGVVIVAALSQARVAAPIVRDDQRPRSDGASHKSAQRFGASVSGDCQPNAPRIRLGPSGIPRSTYSFRHTYATFRLSEGIDSYFLAQQMGTSVKMIEEHHGHVSPVKNADRILHGMSGWQEIPAEAKPEAASKGTKASANRPAARQPRASRRCPGRPEPRS